MAAPRVATRPVAVVQPLPQEEETVDVLATQTLEQEEYRTTVPQVQQGDNLAPIHVQQEVADELARISRPIRERSTMQQLLDRSVALLARVSDEWWSPSTGDLDTLVEEVEKKFLETVDSAIEYSKDLRDQNAACLVLENMLIVSIRTIKLYREKMSDSDSSRLSKTWFVIQLIGHCTAKGYSKYGIDKWIEENGGVVKCICDRGRDVIDHGAVNYKSYALVGGGVGIGIAIIVVGGLLYYRLKSQ